MFTEKVSILVPGGVTQIIDIQASADDGDDDIARRLARNLPVGTIVGVSGGKWRVTSQDPPRVAPADVKDVEVPPSAEDAPKVGEVWRPKDPRRKSGFTIKAVTETDVLAEDGRTVSLERMKRYERVE